MIFCLTPRHFTIKYCQALAKYILKVEQEVKYPSSASHIGEFCHLLDRLSTIFIAPLETERNGRYGGLI